MVCLGVADRHEAYKEACYYHLQHDITIGRGKNTADTYVRDNVPEYAIQRRRLPGNKRIKQLIVRIQLSIPAPVCVYVCGGGGGGGYECGHAP